MSTRDVTDRKDAEERYRKLFENLTSGFALHEVVLDQEGRVEDYRFLEVNPAYERMTGLHAKDLIGRTVKEVLPGVEPFWIERFGCVAQTGTPLRQEDYTAPLDRWYETWAYRPAPGQFAVLLTDITERRESEQEIRELNATLEWKVQDRTQELQHAVEELESFSYSVSHDLRSPLRAIDGFSLALIEDAGPNLTPELRNYLDRIRSASAHMGQLIDDLLELSRSSRIELRKRRLDLSEISHEILENLRSQDPSRTLSCKLDPDMAAEGDPILVRSILENLLGNSWKYCAERDETIIEVSLETIDGRRWIQVRDNGVGFDMAHAGKLFGTFQRLHGGTRFPGTGIGLATVKKLVERHGGTITGTGAPNNGAVFRFTLDPVPKGPR